MQSPGSLAPNLELLSLESPEFLRDRLTKSTLVLSVTNKATPPQGNRWIPKIVIEVTLKYSLNIQAEKQ